MEKCRCCWPPSWCGIFIDPEHTLIRVEFLICWGAKQPVLEGGWIKLYSCFAFFREWSMFSTFFLGFSNSNQTKTRPCKNQSLETSSPGFRSWLSSFFLPLFWISEMPGVSMSSFIWNRQTQEWNFPIFIRGDALGAPHCTVDGTN